MSLQNTSKAQSDAKAFKNRSFHMPKQSNVQTESAGTAMKIIQMEFAFKFWKNRGRVIQGLLNLALNSFLLMVFFANSAYAQLASANRLANLNERDSPSQSTKCGYNSKRHHQALSEVLKTQRYRKIKRQATANLKKILIGAKEFDPVLYWRAECYQSIAVYVDHHDRLELRATFLVHPLSYAIYLIDANGEYTRLLNR